MSDDRLRREHAELLKQSYLQSGFKQGFEAGYAKAKEDFERPQWIPCSERLPEESLDSVIGWDRFRERCVFVQYMDGHFQITGKQESFDVIAWMPLPKPYKRGEAE